MRHFRTAFWSFAGLLVIGLVACTSVGNAPHVSAASLTSPPPVVNSSAAAQSACSQSAQHEYEVCFAYLFNDTLAARVPLYQDSRSLAPGYYNNVRESCAGYNLGQAATCRLLSRYYGAASAFLENQAKTWPAQVEVSWPQISIDQVTSNLSTNTATISDHETWLVKTEAGQILFAETNQPHTITLSRVQGILLHKWVVTSIN